jgi:sulfite exporter TauE/SafE
MGSEVAVLASALVLGFAGSVHCVAMCGGIAGALHQAMPPRGPIESSLRGLLYSLGRVTSYAMAGAIAGSVGSVFEPAARSLGLIRVAVGLVIIVIGLQIAFGGRVFAPLERVGLAVWRLASPLARRIGRPERAWQIFALGLVWGWLPCGLVYSALVLAAASGRAASGALAMAAFGLGTLPAVWAATGFGALLTRLGGGASVRRSAGFALVVFGLWSIVGTSLLAAVHSGPHPGSEAGSHAAPPAHAFHPHHDTP